MRYNSITKNFYRFCQQRLHTPEAILRATLIYLRCHDVCQAVLHDVAQSFLQGCVVLFTYFYHEIAN